MYQLWLKTETCHSEMINSEFAVVIVQYSVCVCVCVCACMRVCVRACVCLLIHQLSLSKLGYTLRCPISPFFSDNGDSNLRCKHFSSTGISCISHKELIFMCLIADFTHSLWYWKKKNTILVFTVNQTPQIFYSSRRADTCVKKNLGWKSKYWNNLFTQVKVREFRLWMYGIFPAESPSLSVTSFMLLCLVCQTWYAVMGWNQSYVKLLLLLLIFR